MFTQTPEQKAHMRLWVADLRVPGRKQAPGRLCRQQDGEIVGFCCLGRVYEVADTAGVEVIKVYNKFNHQPGDISYSFAIESVSSEIELTPAARKWLGVEDAIGWVPGLFGRHEGRPEGEGDSQISLVELNDSGCTFAQIADVIEYFWQLKETADV